MVNRSTSFEDDYRDAEDCAVAKDLVSRAQHRQATFDELAAMAASERQVREAAAAAAQQGSSDGGRKGGPPCIVVGHGIPDMFWPFLNGEDGMDTVSGVWCGVVWCGVVWCGEAW